MARDPIQIWCAAHDEAGHAVAAKALGFPVGALRLMDEGEAAGAASLGPALTESQVNTLAEKKQIEAKEWLLVEKRLAVGMAGQIAADRLLSEWGRYSQNRVQEIVMEMGEPDRECVRSIIAMQFNSDGERNASFGRVVEMANDIVHDPAHWAEIRRLAARLEKERSLSQERVASIIDGG